MTTLTANVTQVALRRTSRLNAGALALAFGVAGSLEAVLLISVAGAMWGMMDGSVGSMHRSIGGTGYATMMAGGAFGSLLYASVCGFISGALAGYVSAWIYNFAITRNTSAQP